MIELVKQIRGRGTRCAILSDQVDWLDRLNERDAFYPLFDRVFNSYSLGQSKQDPELFTRVIDELRIRPEEALFMDDSAGNVHRAWIKGLSCILYTGKG